MKEYSKFISACIIGLKILKPPWCTTPDRGLSNGTKSTPSILIKNQIMIFIKFSLMKTLENSITQAKHWQITLVHLWYSIQGLHIMANGRTTTSKL
jgi:hypothetical protein